MPTQKSEIATLKKRHRRNDVFHIKKSEIKEGKKLYFQQFANSVTAILNSPFSNIGMLKNIKHKIKDIYKANM